MVAHLTEPATRSDIYAWYSLLGTAGTAFGIMTCGWVSHHLSKDLQWEVVDAHRLVFVAYAVLGLFKLVLALLLSSAVEVEKTPSKLAVTTGAANTETTPLLDQQDETVASRPKSKNALRRLLPDISKQSLAIVMSLCLLFALDSFASGLAPLYGSCHIQTLCLC